MLYVTGLALVAGVVIGLAGGGRFRFLAQRRMRASWLVAVGFGLQYATDHLKVAGLGTVMVLTGAVALLAFAALNPNLIGIGVVAAGVAANALVIGVNNGMPVRPEAVVAAHIATRAEEPALGYGYRHHREGPGEQLRPLGDIIPIPLFREVVSFGDLILAFGVAATIAHLLQPVPRHATGGGDLCRVSDSVSVNPPLRGVIPTQNGLTDTETAAAAASPSGTLAPSWPQDDMLAPRFTGEPDPQPPQPPGPPEPPASRR